MAVVTTTARTVADWLGIGRVMLDDADRGDAEVLLGAVTGKSRAELIAGAELPISDDEAAEFVSLIQRRAAGEPVAYLVGAKEFWSVPLSVTPAVLIPRAESELLVEEVLARVSERESAVTVLELGTGCGAIAIALARELPAGEIVATDISADALVVAEGNAVAAGVSQIRFYCGDWFAAVPSQRFDFIVANPPYVAADDAHLTDLRFEPTVALVSADDGLADLKKIVAGASAYLNANGTLLLEHGYQQGEKVRELLQQAGFGEVKTKRDLSGNERVSGAGSFAVNYIIYRRLRIKKLIRGDAGLAEDCA